MKKYLMLTIALGSLCLSLASLLPSIPSVNASTPTPTGATIAGLMGWCNVAANDAIVYQSFNNINSKPIKMQAKNPYGLTNSCIVTFPFKAKGHYFLTTTSSASTISIIPPSAQTPRQLEIQFYSPGGAMNGDGGFFLLVY